MSEGNVLRENLIIATTSKEGHANSEADSGGEMDYVEDDIALDPKHLNRVHEELEKLNIATDVINKLEMQLDAARTKFREIQTTWSQKLNDLSKKYGSAIAKGRPYYEAKLEERRLREEAQNAAIRFERANSMHAVAKQQVKLTQDSLNRQKTIEPECLEVLNHHIQRVNEAEKERIAAEEAHRAISVKMAECSARIATMQKENGRAIKKSRHYFEQRVQFAKVLENQKRFILELETEVRQKKFDYTTSLRNLEQISDSIHEERSLSGMRREAGNSSPGSFTGEGVKTRKKNRKTELDKEQERRREDHCEAVKGIKSKLDEITSLECDKTIDPSIFDEEPTTSASEGRESRSGNLGSGVILLAQHLIGNCDKKKEAKDFIISSELSDFRYRTELPDGVGVSGTLSSPEASDSESSLASSRTGATNTTENLSEMLRSHSMLIEDIDECTQRTESLLRSISDVERESSSGDSFLY
ncbi:unnamed protein product [Enterobius vermicularis]|uniref:SH3 domain-binding protein 5-like n=1 Tax=Enterobius vermicularis TaxID=51028 RepID=A0A0N4VP84_ENTVE|nr:unnamed protein product [Enterobius vermicularis]